MVLEPTMKLHLHIQAILPFVYQNVTIYNMSQERVQLAIPKLLNPNQVTESNGLPKSMSNTASDTKSTRYRV